MFIARKWNPETWVWMPTLPPQWENTAFKKWCWLRSTSFSYSTDTEYLLCSKHYILVGERQTKHSANWYIQVRKIKEGRSTECGMKSKTKVVKWKSTRKETKKRCQWGGKPGGWNPRSQRKKMFEEGSDPRFQMLIKSDNIWKNLTTTFTCVEGTGNLERSSFVRTVEIKKLGWSRFWENGVRVIGDRTLHGKFVAKGKSEIGNRGECGVQRRNSTFVCCQERTSRKVKSKTREKEGRLARPVSKGSWGDGI